MTIQIDGNGDRLTVDPEQCAVPAGTSPPPAPLDQHGLVRASGRKIHLKEDVGAIAGTRRSEDSESRRGAVVARQLRGRSRTLRDRLVAAPCDLPDIGHPGFELLTL